MNEIRILSEGGGVDSDMETVQLEINGKEYMIYVAHTPEQREEGLQNVAYLPENEGMIFVFEEPQHVEFWMKDTLIPLDIIYIDEYFEVVEVQHGIPLDEELHGVDDIQFVLELNAGSGVQKGDEIDLDCLRDDDGDFDFDETVDEESEEGVMQVLDSEGDSQMDLKGGERIFSRPNTKTLIRLAKRAYRSKEDKDYKALGKRLFKYLDVQNNKQDDYVELPETEKA